VADRPTTRVRVVIVDDHVLFRDGLRELLEGQEIDVVGQAGDAETALELVPELAPDVVLMDLSLPGASGIEAIARLAASAPQVRIVALSLASDESTVLQALLAGAAGYIVKDARTDEIVAAVRAAANGMSALSPGVTGAVLGRLRSAPGATEAEPAEEGPRPELTARELEVLRHLVAGEDNNEIADALVISPQTVKNHVSRILAKLDVPNRTLAAVEAVRRGLT